MAELVFQTWERITGRPWSAAAAGGFTDGSFDANIALQQRLLGGWNPFAPTPSPAPAPRPSPTPSPQQAPVVQSPGPVPVDPGLLAQQWEAMITLQKYIADLQDDLQRLDITERGRIADLQAEIDRATLAQNQLQFEASLAFDERQFGLSQQEFDQRVEQFRQQFGLSREQFDFQKESFAQEFGLRREQFDADFGLRERQFEAQQEQFAQQFGLEEERFGLERTLAEANLAANPSNFVALELYKRSLEEQGITAPSGRGSIGDEGIQDLFSMVLGLEEGPTQGTGQFGVDIPTPGAISRSQAGQFSESDIALLSSFLKGGVDVGEGEFAGINPADFFQEVEEGFIPTVDPGLTEVRF